MRWAAKLLALPFGSVLATWQSPYYLKTLPPPTCRTEHITHFQGCVSPRKLDPPREPEPQPQA